jgi:hypothetical protein
VNFAEGGYSAVITLGNTPNVDILCSNQQGTRFAHIQVKTFVPGNRTCSVGMKAMKNVGPTFFWVLGGIPLADSDKHFEYYIIPSGMMAKNVGEAHNLWLATPAKKGNRTWITRFEQFISHRINLLAAGTFHLIAIGGI